MIQVVLLKKCLVFDYKCFPEIHLSQAQPELSDTISQKQLKDGETRRVIRGRTTVTQSMFLMITSLADADVIVFVHNTQADAADRQSPKGPVV